MIPGVEGTMPTTFKSVVEKPNYYKLAISAVNARSDDKLARVLVNTSKRNGDESFFTDKNGKSEMQIDEGGSIEVNSADFDEEKLQRTERIVLHLAELNRENLKL